jgi:signal peptidase I
MPAKALEEKATGWWHYVRVMAITIAVVVCLRVFIFDVVQVNGGSMIPTLHNTDSLISSKIAYRLNDPQRFDIVLLDAPDQSGYFIKRVIGLPNERIEIRSGMVFINGELLSEEYLNNIYTDGDTDTVIPEGCYFVMGDNRPISRDSRSDSIRNIAKEHIKGKAIFRFYPFSSFKIL